MPKGYDKNKTNSIDYDNKNSSINNNISEVDAKKWYIHRTEKTLEAVIKNLESERTQNKSEADLIEDKFMSVRNPILSATPIALSIILGLYSARIFDQFILQILLFADVFIGLIAFIVFSLIKRKIHHLILSMDNDYAIAVHALDYLATYITFNTSFLDEIQLDRLEFFLVYTRFAASTVGAILISGLYNISKSVFFRKTKLPEEYKNTMGMVISAIREYEQNISYFDMHLDDLKEIYVVHQNFFNYHGYKIDKQTGEISKR